MFINERDFWFFVAVLILFGAGCASILFFGLPVIWQVIKPIIHSLSA